MNSRFWNWEPPAPNTHDGPAGSGTGRVLRINGTIAEESWFDDDVTPALFASELNAGSGDVTVWINSPGGDVVAAAQIYNMLTIYPGEVRVCIDGIAASAASVIAMAGDKVAMSPVSMLMIHNPATLAVGDKDELAKAMSMLEAVKDSIINAYEAKTGLSRAKLSKLMDAETWMDARAAIEMGFADHYLTGNLSLQDPDENTLDEVKPDSDDDPDGVSPPDGQKPKNRTLPESGGVLFSRKPAEQQLIAKLTTTDPTVQAVEQPVGRRVVDLYAKLTKQPH
ncbi:MAG: Clp protease ClpP [Actinomycetaceae bacterium]|nr:Clp protease ClpP [Actinomycetaceae bacterium]